MTRVIVTTFNEGHVLRSSVPPTYYPHEDGVTPAWGSWSSSGFPLLSTPDADTSYGEVTATSPGEPRAVGKRLGPWALPPGFTPTRCWVNYQAYSTSPVRWRVQVETTFAGAGSFLSVNSEDVGYTGWRTGRLDLGLAGNEFILATFLAAAADARLLLYCDGLDPSTGLLSTEMFKVSWIELVFATDQTPPMQLMQRNDGLGMGTKRLFDPGTRQTTGRPLGKY